MNEQCLWVSVATPFLAPAVEKPDQPSAGSKIKHIFTIRPRSVNFWDAERCGAARVVRGLVGKTSRIFGSGFASVVIV